MVRAEVCLSILIYERHEYIATPGGEYHEYTMCGYVHWLSVRVHTSDCATRPGVLW